MYRADKEIDPTGHFAVCPECGYKQPFLRLPLLVVSGASGSGKTAVCQALLNHVAEAVLLDSDILWMPEFNKPETKYHEFFETWLRVCKNISQSGRPVVLFGAGVGVPENLEKCIERRYFSAIHFLALVCTDKVLAERLKRRPPWRGTRDAAFIAENQCFNRWFKSYDGEPLIQLLDTTTAPIEQTAQMVHAWIKEKVRVQLIPENEHPHPRTR